MARSLVNSRARTQTEGCFGCSGAVELSRGESRYTQRRTVGRSSFFPYLRSEYSARKVGYGQMCIGTSGKEGLETNENGVNDPSAILTGRLAAPDPSILVWTLGMCFYGFVLFHQSSSKFTPLLNKVYNFARATHFCIPERVVLPILLYSGSIEPLTRTLRHVICSSLVCCC